MSTKETGVAGFALISGTKEGSMRSISLNDSHQDAFDYDRNMDLRETAFFEAKESQYSPLRMNSVPYDIKPLSSSQTQVRQTSQSPIRDGRA